MQIKITKTALTVNRPPAEVESILEALPAVFTVKPVTNGFTVTAPPALLFDLLFTLSREYDLELI